MILFFYKNIFMFNKKIDYYVSEATRMDYDLLS